MKHYTRLIFLLILAFLSIKSASSQEIPRVLNADLREARKSRLQFSPFLGLYTGDTVSTSYIAGSRAAYHWSRHFATAVDFGYSPLEVDPQSAYGSTVTHPRLFHLNGVLIGTLPAAVKVGHKKVLEMDIYGLAGAGWLNINRADLVNGVFGIGTLLYLKPPWLALQMEVRNYFYALPIGRGGFSIDTVIVVGPTFLFIPAVF
ncbi:MAG: hypothetical protein HY609_02220 [Deltaproteobacteria bacterium]|nr:hypothetical protein [Deltaproteobacteria bacterium]MBI4223724.1 hypothetical protein [Deltaproteobacteria bacterium]